jgi:hypothetical protein
MLARTKAGVPMAKQIDYGNLMHQAFRGLIRRVLSDVAERGLPGAHHFFITFDTTHPDVDIADWLAERYPQEMTIVLQHWYDNLEVDEDGFAVTLNFGDSPEPLYIPLDAILTFVDPSVEFGLRFESHESGTDDPPDAPQDGPDDQGDPAPARDAEIVRLDAFRKT